MPVLLTSKPHETPWNISETLKNLRKVSKRATKPLENGFSLNFDQFPWIFRCTKSKNKASVYFITQIQPKNANIVLNNEKKESQQHPVFPGGHPSKYWLGSMLLNYSDRTRTGVFNMIWPLARAQENVNILFQQHTYLLTYMRFCTQVRLKLGWLELRLFPQLPTGFLSVSSSLKPLLPCFEHFYAWNTAKICNLRGIFKPKNPDLLFESRLFKTRKV